MERTLTPDEKIRKIEELYYQKKIQAGKQNSARVNVIENDKHSRMKTMILQILICIMLYVIFYIIKNYNYVFSSDVINKAKELLAYDTNFSSLYSGAIQYIEKDKGDLEENIIIENPTQTNNTNMIEETLSITEELETSVLEENIGVSSGISQMEEDAKKVKEEYSIIKPLEGTITSSYGTRSPTTEGVSTYHTGIDIAKDKGTEIIAAMEGTVELVSSEGNYRKPYKDSKW